MIEKAFVGRLDSLARLSRRAAGIELTPIQRALEAVTQPGILSLAMGLPDPKLLPVEQIAKACSKVLARNSLALQYTLPCLPLKEKICSYMRSKGVSCSPDAVFLTQGAQQGLNLLSILLLNSHSLLAEEALSYPGFQHLTEAFDPEVLTIPTDISIGIDVEVLAGHLSRGQHPAMIYLMPNAHNPSGARLPMENRAKLAGLARKYRVPIVEDDPYGELYYDTNPLPPIRAFEADWVYYVGSFSKILGPSLRVGWIVAPEEHIPLLSVIKESHDLNVTTLSQWIVNEFLESAELISHLGKLRDAYQERRDVMDRVLREVMPSYVRWKVPDCGVFLWVELPEFIKAAELFGRCISEKQVAFLPAAAFSRGKQNNGIRLNFSHKGSCEIAEGVARIGSVVRQMVV